MQSDLDPTRRSRREFLTIASSGALALAGAASARGHAPGEQIPDGRHSRPSDADIARGDGNATRVPFQPVDIPDWVYDVSRMSFLSPGEIDQAAAIGVQVVHGNAVWPYFPLRKDGGGLSEPDTKTLRGFVEGCHKHQMKLVLGLPPFPAVDLVKAHPDWRVHPDDTGAVLSVEPREDNLGTRVGCNLGPWGDYLIEVCGEFIEDFDLDGYSFDGNYHPPICYCPACKQAYQRDAGQAIPPAANLDDLAYRKYLVWRGERLEDHYRRLQQRIKTAKPTSVLMSWTVNAGRYGHFLHSPRAMPTRLNLLFDLPMQEWWLDETNFGASVAPAFGAAYLSATTGGRPNASEPYLMSRGNPYGTDSFPRHERITRAMLVMTSGGVAAESLGWPGGADAAASVYRQVETRRKWTHRATPMRWGALLCSEQTRQFYAYRDIANHFLPAVFGAFRCGLEEHLPLSIVNDWDLDADGLKGYRVLVLPSAAALSEMQCAAIRQFVEVGGGLVASAETSLFDELGQVRYDFALADLFGVSYEGTQAAPLERPELDANFAITVDDAYWQQRTGVATLTWPEHAVWADKGLNELVPARSARFRGPLVLARPRLPVEVVASFEPEGSPGQRSPAVVLRNFGAGRVAYLAAGLDAALWSYAYPYQRVMLSRLMQWAAGEAPAISISAPKCVQASFYRQHDGDGRRTVIHLFNGLNTTANHGLPAVDVPLREETVPIAGIEVRIAGPAPKRLHVEPGDITPEVNREGDTTIARLPPLELHAMLVIEE